MRPLPGAPILERPAVDRLISDLARPVSVLLIIVLVLLGLSVFFNFSAAADASRHNRGGEGLLLVALLANLALCAGQVVTLAGVSQRRMWAFPVLIGIVIVQSFVTIVSWIALRLPLGVLPLGLNVWAAFKLNDLRRLLARAS